MSRRIGERQVTNPIVAIFRCLVLALPLLGVVSACATDSRTPAVPAGQEENAEIPGIPNARFYPDGNLEPFIATAIESVRQEMEQAGQAGDEATLPPASYLAVSGGGDNGAFGAGLLVGWTETGARPEFKLVTGVSTGALTAPFAFLGPDYDEQLKNIYTTISANDVFEARGAVEIPFSDAMADTSPLWALVRQYASQEMLEAIAAEHADGRVLLIATTNLDSLRPVVWNIGEIAASGDPKALDLFHRILVASAAVPGAFPPVFFDVEVDGEPYQEMHVDGGAMTQSFIYPPSLSEADLKGRLTINRKRTAYIIRNARLDPNWASVEPHIFSIAGRSISSLIQSQGVGDLYMIYLQSERDNVDYNLAYIPSDFEVTHEEEFDPAYMNALFDYAYRLARNGYEWNKYPPGYDPGT